MKIIGLKAENIKRIKAVEINPDGSLVQITGANGQGKTSVLDAIWWALQGGKNIQTTPIRRGEEQAVIKLDLGEFTVTREFKAKEDGKFTTKLQVATPEGARFTSPQQMLDEMLGELTFDPLAFTRMKPDQQVSAMRLLVPEFDFEQNDRVRNEAFSERTFANRRHSEAKATAENLAAELPEDQDAPERVDSRDLAEKWQQAFEHNDLIRKRAEKRKTFEESADALGDQIKKLQAQLDDALTEIASWEPLPEPVDADGIKAKLDNAQQINAIADRFENAKQHRQKADVEAKKAAELTATIERCRQAERDAISSANIPVDGMVIENGVVELDGVPFDQASDAQQLQASIAIAMALNPKLKVIRVRDGSLLDENAMRTLEKMAANSGYQVWIERVDTTGEVGFVIEDGHLKSEPQETPKSDADLFGG